MRELTLITCPRCGDAFDGDTFYCPYCERLRVQHTPFERLVLGLSYVGLVLLCIVALLGFIVAVAS